MSQNFDVTSANAEVILAVEDLYPSGISLQQFSVDNVASAEPVEVTETRRGVDGKMVAGVIKNVTSVTIVVEAASPSLPALEYIRDAMKANNRPYECTLTIYQPALEKVKTYVRGVLKSAPPMPAIQRTLQPTSWTFDFEDVF